MHKEKYIIAVMQIIEFENEDVITTSGIGGGSSEQEPDIPNIPDPDPDIPDTPDPDEPNPDDPSLNEDIDLSTNEIEVL